MLCQIRTSLWLLEEENLIRVYKDSYEDTTTKIAGMERLETQESEDGTQSSVDTFGAVMELDHPGRVRLYERGVTKTLLKQNAGDSGPSLSVANNKMMQKRMDELGERMQQTMLEKFNAKKDTIERDVTMNIIAQLQRLNPQLVLDPNMLRFNVCLPGEEAAIQPINHISAGSNNQGTQLLRAFAHTCLVLSNFSYKIISNIWNQRLIRLL